MKKLFLFVFIIFSYTANAQLWSGILAPSHGVDWTNAGISGGVPNITTICTTLGLAGQLPTFAQSVTVTNINSAITSCNGGSGGVVFLNTGTYTIAGEIVMKSNVVLRGAGPNNTLLQFSGQGSACSAPLPETVGFCGSFNWSGGPQHLTTWTGGYTQGGTSITVGSTAGLTVGQVIILDQADDASDTGNYYVCSTTSCSTEGGSPGRVVGGTTYSQQEYKVVTNISGTTVTITPPLYSPNWRSGQTPGVWWATTLITNAGIENLTLDDTNSGLTNGSVIMYWNAYKCWTKNIRSIYASGSSGGRNHIWLQYSKNIIVRDSYFFGTRAASTLSYGVETWQTGDDLIENNIFQQVVSPLLVGNTEGTVFGYNFGVNNFNNNPNFNMPGPVFTHDAGTAYNLFEGNQGTGTVEDNIHGTHNMHTYFRNQWFAIDTPGKSSQLQAFEDSSFARYMNLIANVMGSAGTTNVYQVIAPTSTNCNTAVFSFGFQSSGCATPLDATLVSTTSLRWGNWDTITNATRWCGNSSDTGWSTTCGSTSEIPTGIGTFPNPVPTLGDTTAGQGPLPVSFYLTSTPPVWWQFTATTASPFPAVGPDVTGGTVTAGSGTGSNLGGHAYLIPARSCYLHVMGGNAGGTGSVLSFDANSCYVATGPTAPAVMTTTASSITVTTASSGGTVTSTGGASITDEGVCYATTNNPTAPCTHNGTATPFTSSLTGLAPSTLYYYRAFATNSVGTGYGSTFTFTTLNNITASPLTINFGNQTVLTSSSPSNVTLTNSNTSSVALTSITMSGDFSQTNSCGGTISGSGGTCVIHITFTPTIVGARSGSLVVVPSVGGTITVPLSGTGLAAPTAPTVTTTTASSITTTSAVSGGVVTSNGGASVTSEGVCYATTPNPTSPCTSNGTATPFTSNLTSLASTTTYNYRAFATNSVGTGYGANLTFTTLTPSGGGGNTQGGGNGTGHFVIYSSTAVQPSPYLPLIRVQNTEYYTALSSPTFTITFPISGTGGGWVGGGPYTAGSQTSLNQSIADIEAYRTTHLTSSFKLVVPPQLFSGPNGLVIPQTVNDTSSQFIVITSSTPLPTGTIPCVKGIQDNTTVATQPGINNWGCTGSDMSYQLGKTVTNISPGAFTLQNGVNTNTSAYNDVASMWTSECTNTSCDAIHTAVPDVNGVAPHHFAILNFEARPQAGLTQPNAPVKIGQGSETASSQLPTHIHLAYFYIHGDWTKAPVSGGVATGPPTGTNSIPAGINLNCIYCSTLYYYMDKMIRPGAEGHGINLSFVQEYKNAHYWIECCSIGVFGGGQVFNIPMTGFVDAQDVEDRVGNSTYPWSWTLAYDAGFNPNGGSDGYVRKNAHELKSANRYLYDGYIVQHIDGSGGQSGITQSWKTSNCSSSSFCTNYWIPNQNVTVSNGISRLACQGGSWGFRSAGSNNGGGVAQMTKNALWSNNLTYGIDLANPGCGGVSPIIGFRVNNQGGNTWTASATRDGAGLTATYTLTSASGLTQSNFNPGDPTTVYNCLDTSFNTVLTAQGPPALSGTVPTGLTVIIANTGTANASTTGCTVSNVQGQPQNLTHDHNSDFINSGTFDPYFLAATTPTIYVMSRNMRFTNDLVVNGGISSTFTEGSTTQARQMDPASEIVIDDIFAGRNMNNYTQYSFSSVPSTPPTQLYGTTSFCTGSNPVTGNCIGVIGAMSQSSFPLVFNDYHNLRLCHTGDTACSSLPSLYSAGQANAGSDGMDLGANIVNIDAAQVSTQYPGGYPDF